MILLSGEYFIFYVEASIVCVLIFSYLLIRDLLNKNKPEKQIKFDYSLIAHILYFISDVFWAGVIGGQLPRTRLLVVGLNFANFLFMSMLAYEWFLFAAATEGVRLTETKKGRWLIRAPFLIMTAAMIAVYIINPEYWVSAQGDLNPAYYPMMLAAPLIYVFSSSICSLLLASRKENAPRRKMLILIGLYPLTVVLFGLLQLSALNAPLFCFGTTLMMLFFYIQSLDDQISVDPLTRLNNRSQIFRFAAQEENHRRGDVRSYVIMADVNRFKQINDTFGHAEGDRALITIAGTLKKTALNRKTPPFIGRFGGDEFILIAHEKNEEDVGALIGDIRGTLEKTARESSLPYPLTVSIGYAELKENESFQACFQRADEALYEDKAAFRRAQGRA